MAKPKVSGFKDFMRRAGWASLALLFVVTALGGGIYVFISGTKNKTNQNQPSQLKGTQLKGFTPIAKVDKLTYSDIRKGKGTVAKLGNNVTVNYVGALAASGLIFDDSYDAGSAVPFDLIAGGPNGVIPGFAKGIDGMKVGGEREIFIPAALGYGKQGAPPTIPPNADLVFDVVLVGVKK